MLVFIGDIHGSFTALAHILRKYEDRSDVTFIQVGDFGFWPQSQYRREWDAAEIRRPVYFIDGNHDHIPSLVDLQAVTEVWPNAFYIPRGSVMKLDGRWMGFLGGAASVDAKWRTYGVDWFPNEIISEDDVKKFSGKQIDLLVTHTPPDDCVQANFDSRDLERFFDLPRTWRDISAQRLEALREELGRPPIVCGHMHKQVFWHGVRILGVNEAYEVYEKGAADASGRDADGIRRAVDEDLAGAAGTDTAGGLPPAGG